MNRNTDALLKSCFETEFDQLEDCFREAYSVGRTHFDSKIAFYAPGMVHFETEFYSATDPWRFPSISVTGTHCALNCEHCNGQLLETMIPALTPEALWETCMKIKDHGGKGALISGGSTPRGNTPMEKFVPTIKRVKNELDLDIVVHTGVVYPDTVEKLAVAGIDGAMLDIIGSDDTIREVYHLDLTTSAFDKSLSLLEEYGVPMMPHIIAGLHYGQLHGEDNAIKMIAKYNPESVIIVAFKPLDHTPMEQTIPASPTDIARVILAARLVISKFPVVLGCARPHGEHRRITDRLAIRAGVNGIAYPTEEAYHFAKQLGLDIVFSDECCSLMTKTLANTRA